VLMRDQGIICYWTSSIALGLSGYVLFRPGKKVVSHFLAQVIPPRMFFKINFESKIFNMNCPCVPVHCQTIETALLGHTTHWELCESHDWSFQPEFHSMAK
jgi:hypothetical protein